MGRKRKETKTGLGPEQQQLNNVSAGEAQVERKERKELRQVFPPGTTLTVYECLFYPHDFFFYVAKEIKTGLPEKVIHNTALLYALNRDVEALHRTASGQIPHYNEDAYKFKIYSTPAMLADINTIKDANRVLIGKNELLWESSQDLVRFTFNSVHTVTQSTQDQNVNLPALGWYLKYPPLVPFRAFVFGSQPPPPLVRLGKKPVPIRIRVKEVKGTVEEGRFECAHPVNIRDLPEETKLLSGSMIVMPPIPLFIRCILEGLFVRLKNEMGECVVLPDLNNYPNVKVN
ncbi:MAG: type I-D CRISPR-associated protein Cas5/Csc1 [Thermoplasmata archaeon]